MREIEIKKLHNGLCGVRDSFVQYSDVLVKHKGKEMVLIRGAKPLFRKRMDSKFGPENDYEIFMYRFDPYNGEQMGLF